MPYGILHGFPKYGSGEDYASIGLVAVRAGCCGNLPCQSASVGKVAMAVSGAALDSAKAVVTAKGFPVGAAVGGALGLALGLLFTSVGD